MFQFLLPILAGLGHFASGTLAGLTGAGEGLTGAAALGANLGAPLAEAGIGALIGGPQGAMQLPLMAGAARRATAGKLPQQSPHVDPGMSVPGADGGHGGGLSMFTQSPVMMPILGGLAGRLFGGGPAGGLAGIGMGGLLDPKFGPLANSSHLPPGLLELLLARHKAGLGNTNPDPMLLPRPRPMPYGPPI